jgi:rhodanese-related sulfurtransferase
MKGHHMSIEAVSVAAIQSPEHRHPLPGARSFDSDVGAILPRARARGAAAGLPYAGEVSPEEAWELFSAGAAEIVDVRTAEERKFVGHVPDSAHVAWATGLSLTKNPRFLRELEAKRSKDAVILLICRSAKRSDEAAVVAARAGWQNVFNVLEGFEGERDERQQRGSLSGWRLRGLPWVQD